MAQKNAKDWWKGAVIYQVYPRSFRDSNGDGIGDLPGITEKMDYISSLGVDAVWISPFFKSPMRDFGYDVSDYCDVDPMFGTLDDFKKLIAAAHKRNIKIIIDLVLSHTSDEHEWFIESKASRDNAKADWYVWADPKPDGTAPNNWMSVFGGPSWEYSVRRGQYYLHNFLVSQPDLNLHNPEVRKALLDAARFWLDLGVDGFRLDAAAHFFHNPNLKDNPPNPDAKPAFFNIAFPTPFTMQKHVYDISIPESLAFMEEMRALLDQYEGRMAVAEIGGENGIELAAEYTAGDKRLHTAYNFSLISGEKPSATFITSALEKAAAQPGNAWPSWAFSNHDVTRVLSRWGKEAQEDPRLGRTLMAALCSLRGSTFIYQGEELGLTDTVIPYEMIQDPWGRYLYPEWQGRDGCRTPMPWNDNGKSAGFSDGTESWLPVADAHRALNVAAQEKDAASTLAFSKAFLEWRKGHDALITGDAAYHRQNDDNVLSFVRSNADEQIMCIFNFGGREATITLPTNAKPDAKPFDAGAQTGRLSDDGKSVTLPPYGVYCASVGVS